MTDGVSGHGFDRMNSMFASNQSSSHFLNQSDKDAKILVDYETSSKLVELLKILYANYLQNANLENSSGAYSSKHENYRNSGIRTRDRKPCFSG